MPWSPRLPKVASAVLLGCVVFVGCKTDEQRRTERRDELVKLREMARSSANTCDSSGREADWKYADECDQEIERIDTELEQLGYDRRGNPSPEGRRE